MIGFLHPLLWLAALAAAVPVILHLMRRRQSRRVVFPAIRYLRRAEQRHARRLRLRHFLLLAMRILLIVLAAAAAAGPLIGHGGAGDHRPTALAIVLDNSQSATTVHGDRLAFDQYRDRVRRALDLASPEDRVAIFAAADPTRGVIVPGPDAAREQLAELKPLPDVADLPTALAQAGEWLRSAGEGRELELHILTDLQRISLRRRSEAGPASVTGITDLNVVAYRPPTSELANGAIEDPVPEILPLTAGQENRLSVTLQWYGPSRPDEPTVVRLVRDGGIVGATEAVFGSTAILRLQPASTGWIQGWVEIDRHGLSADDRRYFTWPARPPPRVAIHGDPGPFLTRALDALEQGLRLSRTDTGAQVDVAVDGQGLEESLARGVAVIVLPPESALDLPRLNARLERARVPWRYESAVGVGASRLAEPRPVEGLESVEVRSFYRLSGAPIAAADTVLVRLQSGEPWLVRGVRPGAGSYLLLASPLTPEASTLPVSAAMVPFVDVLVGDWARRGGYTRTRFEGVAPVHLHSRARVLESAEGTERVEPGSWFHPRNAGNFQVTDGDSVLLAFSVNAPIAESDLTPAPPESLEAILPEADWHWVTDADPRVWGTRIFRARQGRPGWRPVVALLVVFAILESALAASGRRREGSPQKQ